MVQITANDINFTIFDDGTIGIAVIGPRDIIAVEMLEYICKQCNALMREAEEINHAYKGK